MARTDRAISLKLPLPPGFDLPATVCSYGFYHLDPNLWDADSRRLMTTLRGRRGRLIQVAITQADKATLRLRCDRGLDDSEKAAVKRAVSRMLRLDEDLRAFHGVHSAARKRKFGRLFRSADLFEDIVKTMTSCNTTWAQTRRMNELLCEQIGGGGFPSPGQLARCDEADLKAKCRVGYRAGRIIQLARDVTSKKISLDDYETAANDNLSTEELDKRLRTIHGVGPFASANLCMLLGRYDRLAIDSETYRHFREVHDTPTPKTSNGRAKLDKRIARHYNHFAPFQFLAYWYELWFRYEFSE